MSSSSQRVSFLPETSIGRYVVTQFLASGGEAATYKAYMQGKHETPVLLQLFKSKEKAENRQTMHGLLKDLDFVPQLLDQFIQEDYGYIVQVYEFINGKPIDECIKRSDMARITQLLRHLCEAVKTLHDMHVYHFDLKTNNILVAGDKVWIIDFGSAQHLTEQSKVQIDVLQSRQTYLTHVYEYTPLFSPRYDIDMQMNSMLIDAGKYDVYSIGSVFYYLIIGECIRQPLKRYGQQTQEISSRFDKNITDLLCGMLDKDQFTRYDISEVLHHPALNPTAADRLPTFCFLHALQLRENLRHNQKPERPASIAKYQKIVQIMKQKHRLVDDQANIAQGLSKNKVCISQLQRWVKSIHESPVDLDLAAKLRLAQIIMMPFELQLTRELNAKMLYSFGNSNSQITIMTNSNTQSNDDTSDSDYEPTEHSEEIVLKVLKQSSRCSFGSADKPPKMKREHSNLQISQFVLNDIFDSDTAYIELIEE